MSAVSKDRVGVVSRMVEATRVFVNIGRTPDAEGQQTTAASDASARKSDGSE